MYRRLLLNVLLAALLAMGSGCSIYEAFSAPGPTDYPAALAEGNLRFQVIDQLGEAVSKEPLAGGGAREIYKFKDGWPIWFNALRGLAHGGADFFTLGLWEIAGIPIEKFVFKPSDATAEVLFDRKSRVIQAVALSSGEVVYESRSKPSGQDLTTEVPRPAGSSR